MDAIEMLVDEHRLIERVLDSLESFSEKVGAESETDRKTVGDFAAFFQKFVDDIHHGKEERYLFVRMKAYGFSDQAGPVSAMLSEQGEGREHLGALASIAHGSGSLSKRERMLVKGHALGYILRIKSHMNREDEILFPVARHALPTFVLQELTEEFEKFDSTDPIGPLREGAVLSARELIARYPSRLERTPSAPT